MAGLPILASTTPSHANFLRPGVFLFGLFSMEKYLTCDPLPAVRSSTDQTQIYDFICCLPDLECSLPRKAASRFCASKQEGNEFDISLKQMCGSVLRQQLHPAVAPQQHSQDIMSSSLLWLLEQSCHSYLLIILLHLLKFWCMHFFKDAT